MTFNPFDPLPQKVIDVWIAAEADYRDKYSRDRDDLGETYACVEALFANFDISLPDAGAIARTTRERDAWHEHYDRLVDEQVDDLMAARADSDENDPSHEHNFISRTACSVCGITAAWSPCAASKANELEYLKRIMAALEYIRGHMSNTFVSPTVKDDLEAILGGTA